MSKFLFFPPKRRQFYFSKELLLKNSKYPLLYKPLSLKAKIIWTLMIKKTLFRSFFELSQKNLPHEIITILKAINSQKGDLHQINIGTKGPEQKYSILKHTDIDTTFYKVGSSEKSKELIQNEYNTLILLNGKFKSAKVINFEQKDDFLFLETSYIQAEKYSENRITEEIFNLLIEISEYKNEEHEDLKTSFSHGDFCPWNLLINNNTIHIIDWEMSAIRPLGYDLFTYIFQTNFLLFPNKNIDDIFRENKDVIKKYFDHFQCLDYKMYISSFVNHKLSIEEKKENTYLANKYTELNTYIEKNHL